MGFTSDFLKEEKKKKKKGTTGDSFTDEFLAYEAGEVYEQEEDIAPVKQPEEKPEEKPAKKTNNSGWFTGGAFSDGYQFGDITKTILGTINDVSENVTQAGKPC